MLKFTYKIMGLKGNIVYTDFCSDGIILEIKAKKISEATDNVRQYLTDNYLKCDRIELIKIEF
jgi:hypothetical protein